MSATRVFPDLNALSVAAIDDLRAISAAAIAARGVCHVALSGGSTPKHLFDVLAGMGKSALPWDRIHLWWGDERTVPPDHPDSNYGMARAHLIDPLGLDAARVHRMEGEGDPAVVARAYEREMIAALGTPPALDLVWLGMGPDGHTASLFPNSTALAEDGAFASLAQQVTVGVRGAPHPMDMPFVHVPRFVVPNAVDSPLTHGKTTRLTFTFTAINAAHYVRFLVAGTDKAERVRAVLTGPPERYPAQSVNPDSGELVWFLDAAAAALLGGGT